MGIRILKQMKTQLMKLVMKSRDLGEAEAEDEGEMEQENMRW